MCNSPGTLHIAWGFKSDLNEVVFVLDLWKLLRKNIKVKTIFIFKKNSIHKNY